MGNVQEEMGLEEANTLLVGNHLLAVVGTHGMGSDYDRRHCWASLDLKFQGYLLRSDMAWDVQSLKV
jgi:hypothetical protein